MSKSTDDKNIKKEKMKKRSFIDRRSGEDRRTKYSLDYFESDGKERRIKEERRQQGERRRKEYSLDYTENDGKEKRVKEERRKQGERRSDLK